MRPSVAGPLLALAIVLAGCTDDGYLGEIDEKDQTEQQQQRLSNYWARAAASHRGDVEVTARELQISDGIPPIALTSATLVPFVQAPPFGEAPTVLLAIAGAELDGAIGWLVLNASGSPTLSAAAPSSELALVGATVHTEGARLFARLPGSPIGALSSYGGPYAPPKPGAIANFSDSFLHGFRFPATTRVDGIGLTFYDENGTSRALTSATVGTVNATLVALASGANAPILGVALDVPLAREDVPTSWSGNLTVKATAPRGTLRLASGEQLLAPYNEASFKMRGEGSFELDAGAEWTFRERGAEFVDVQTGSPRLEAKLRLAPDRFNATGPAGNTTRVKLILAETSLGAEAHVTGYRIDGDVNARYLGWEPFAISSELMRIMQETEGPIAPAVLLTLGVAVPIVAFGEAFANLFQSLFPPSLAGTIGPGEARVLTFELEMPQAPRDVEILIESRNAEPVRATLRLAPLPAT